ncbi:MAG: hypothetical protein GY940_27815 [bacterium]|nr:hypothetical protein [bacterium]
MVENQNKIIQWFVDSKKPLTVGVIMGKDGTIVPKGSWPLAASTIKLITENPSLIEVASHSVAHSSWNDPSNTAAKYLKWMIEGHKVLKGTQGFQTETLIMPYNLFNTQIYDALKDPSCPYKIISTAYDSVNTNSVPPGDGFPVRGSDPSLLWVPSTCATANYQSGVLWNPPLQAVMGGNPPENLISVKNSVDFVPAVNGKKWACIMMHPQTFSGPTEIETYFKDYFNKIELNFSPTYMTMSQFVKWSRNS